MGKWKWGMGNGIYKVWLEGIRNKWNSLKDEIK